MSSGGARARSGPAPERNAIRNGRFGADWIRLPASGRKGDPPAWPASVPRPTKAELAHWAEEWRRPQALMWEAAGQEIEVALYVRAVRIASSTKAKSGDRTLVFRYQDDLGISQGGLAKNRWIIVDDAAVAPEAPTPDGSGRAPIPISDARDRLRKLSNAS